MGMTREIYAIKDIKSCNFLSPYLANNQGLAARDCHQLVNDKSPDSVIACYPADFELWNLGSFDIETGRIKILEEGPIYVLNLSSLKEI